MSYGPRVGEGAALLRSERSKKIDPRVVVGLGLVSMAVLVVIFGTEIHTVLQSLAIDDCVARESGNFPNNIDALVTMCRAAVVK